MTGERLGRNDLRVAWLLGALAFGCLGHPVSAAAPAKEPPIVRIHEGEHWVWYARQDQFDAHRQDIERYFDYADRAFEHLAASWGLKPPQKKYTLLVWPKTGGGFAGDVRAVRAVTGKRAPGIGVSYDAFFNVANGIKGYWGHVLITHEMVNLFTAAVVSPGWPVDWWANHKSPFPLMTAVQIEYALVPEVAVHHARQQDTPLGRMFLRLKDQFGWAMFRRAFAAAIDDGIRWDRFGGNPSALRTNMVCAYLKHGAAEDLAGYMEGVVPSFNAKTVGDILEARARWRALPEGDPKRARLKAAYLRGNYRAVLVSGDPSSSGDGAR